MYITSNRTFGIELEVGVDDISGYHDVEMNLPDDWMMVHDGSNKSRNPTEIVSPVLIGESGEEAVCEVCDLLKDNKFSGDHESCGFHVHLGAKDLVPVEKTMVLSSDELRDLIESNTHEVNDIVYVNASVVELLYGGREDRMYARVGKGEHGRTGLYVTSVSGDNVLISDEKTLFVGRKTHEYRSVTVVTHDQYVSTTQKYNERLSKVRDAINNAEMLEDGSFHVQNKLYDKITDIQAQLNQAVSLLCKQTEGKYVITATDSGPISRLKTILYFYVAFDDVLNGMLPPNRRSGNSFCMPVSDIFLPSEVEAVKTAADFDALWYKQRSPRTIKMMKGEHYNDSRYHNVNLHSLFNRHGTIEIRSHGGTIDQKRILLWTSLHQLIVDRGANEEYTIDMIRPVYQSSKYLDINEKMEFMLELLSPPEHIAEYVRRLVNHFSK